MTFRPVRALGAMLTLLLLPSLAHAQTATGFAVSRFEPAERGSDWFALESLDLRGHVRPAIGIVGEYQYRPLAIYNADGSHRVSVVSDLVLLHPGASLNLWSRLRLAVSLPIQVFEDGTAGAIGTVTYPAPSSQQAIGDLRLGADLRLFGEYGDAITGAIGLQAWMPTGDKNAYAGDGSVRLLPRALVAGDLGPFAYAAKLGVMYHGRSETIASTPIGNEFVFGASAGLRLAERKLLLGPEVTGSTVLEGGSVFGRRTTPMQMLIGAHYDIGEVKLGAAGGFGLTRGFGSPVGQALLTVAWMQPVEQPELDRDHDGILDKDDACPDDKGIRTGDKSTHGCPDRDKDGIVDKVDACPDVPGIASEDPKINGCPPDRDHDGVLDAEDACPDDPGVRTDDPKTNGCPTDRDKDGILDRDDACPDEPGPKRSDPKTHGCPDRDRDKDGVLDKDDACPDTPGKPDPDPKKNGCPMAFVQDGSIVILDQVRFATNSAAIVPGKESQDVLDAVLKVFVDHAEIKKVRIEGHTDSQGSAALNRKLSANRAAAVVKWLVDHGVAKERLTSQGFGPDRPLSENTTAEGRQKNRRVEFHIEGEDSK